MPDHNLCMTQRLDIGAKPKTKGLDAQKIDLWSEQPTRIIFAKSGSLY